MNLFEQLDVTKRFTGTVSTSIRAGWWVVTDSQGKKYRAASSSNDIKIGQRVAIVGGQIVGGAGKEVEPQVYQV